MRERPKRRGEKGTSWGITPARAGKTGCYVIADDGKRDHPHSCGKDCSLFLVPTKGLGSPPLVRERQRADGVNGGNDGITPARAGKTIPLPSWRFARQDHPRSCGKDYWLRRRQCPRGGSPPLVRERLGRNGCAVLLIGITPARAGKTHGPVEYRQGRQDHPHSCGKDLMVNSSNGGDLGSPPLVRERLICKPLKRAL